MYVGHVVVQSLPNTVDDTQESHVLLVVLNLNGGLQMDTHWAPCREKPVSHALHSDVVEFRMNGGEHWISNETVASNR